MCVCVCVKERETVGRLKPLWHLSHKEYCSFEKKISAFISKWVEILKIYLQAYFLTEPITNYFVQFVQVGNKKHAIHSQIV